MRLGFRSVASFPLSFLLTFTDAVLLSPPGGRRGGRGLARPGAPGGGAAEAEGVAAVVATGAHERHEGRRAALAGATRAAPAVHPQHGRPPAHLTDAAHAWVGWVTRLLRQRHAHALAHARAAPESAVLELRGAVQTGESASLQEMP